MDVSSDVFKFAVFKWTLMGSSFPLGIEPKIISDVW